MAAIRLTSLYIHYIFPSKAAIVYTLYLSLLEYEGVGPFQRRPHVPALSPGHVHLVVQVVGVQVELQVLGGF